MQSMDALRASPAVSHFHHECSSHSLEAASFKARMRVLYDRSFHTLIPATKCGDAACGRTTSAVKQKMGHQHKHQRDQPIVSPSKYTEFRYTLLSRGGERKGECERGRKEGERGRQTEQPLERQSLLFVLQALNAPCRQSLNCT